MAEDHRPVAQVDPGQGLQHVVVQAAAVPVGGVEQLPGAPEVFTAA